MFRSSTQWNILDLEYKLRIPGDPYYIYQDSKISRDKRFYPPFHKVFFFRHYFLVKFFLLVSRRSLKKHIPKILLYKQDQDLQKSSSVTGKNILATLSMFLYIYPVRVCVCVCVYTLPPFGFFRLHYVCDIREKFGSTIFTCEYF